RSQRTGVGQVTPSTLERQALTMTHPSRAIPGPRPRHRLLLGGACRDCVLLVAGLKAGAKHPVLFRGRYPGGGGVNAARAHRRLAPPAQPIVLLAATGDDRA